MSNGHGEDVIGSRLALHLAALWPEAEIRAFPLVGGGAAWRAAGVPVLGEARELPSGGLTFHSLGNFARDLAAGLLPVTWRQLADLRRVRTDAVVVTGDIWALTLSLLPKVPAGRRFVVQTLVSTRQQPGLPSPQRLFMERITAPERLLQRRYASRVWLRDEETAAWLRERAVPQASYAGSLLHESEPATAGPPGPARVLLLPGSRAWAHESLALLLPLAALLKDVRFQVAWSRPERPAGLPPGWELQDGSPPKIVSAAATVEFHEHAFLDLLGSASAAVGTAGTAAEQVAAAGLPVLSFELPGRHTRGFLANQCRILGDSLHVAANSDSALLARMLKELLHDSELRLKARRAGARLLGQPGGLRQIAADIHAQLSRD